MRTGKSLALSVAVAILLSVVSFLPATPVAAQSSIDIVALGDSYTAGNGALVYEDHTCWRSGNAYVHQYRKLLQNAGHPSSSKNFACMGAVNLDIVDQLHSAKADLANAEIVVLTIGGNDIKFSKLVLHCLSVFSWTSHASNCEQLIVDADIEGVARKVMDNLRLIQYLAPDAKIVMVGYPYLIAPYCPNQKPGYDTFFEDVRNMQYAADGYYKAIVAHLNNEITGNKFAFVSLLERFRTHEICGSGSKYIRGSFDTLPLNYTKLLNGDVLGAGDEAVAEWWHPNVEGHAAMAKALFDTGVHTAFVETPTSPPTSPSPPSSDQGYTNLPFACSTVVPYVSTYDSYGGYSHGQALDFPMPSGTSVVSPFSGTAYVHYDTNGYGRYIDLVADNGYIYRFAHLQSDVRVNHGQRIGRGTVLGSVGSTGAATGPHLHMEQRSSGNQVAISLGGPALQWGSEQDSSGYRQTTHSLKSHNCDNPPAVGPTKRQFADLMVHEYGKLRFAPSDGHDARSWEVAFDGISTPTDADSCDFDGDGQDEYLSYEKRTSSNTTVMMANPNGSGDFTWTEIVRLGPDTDKITCGDWNGDGTDDLMIHNTQGKIYWGRSNGQKVDHWQNVLSGIGTQMFWDMCDINGDAKQDLVAYEAWGSQLMAGTRNSDFSMTWRRLMTSVNNAGGMTCGSFTAFDYDELIIWLPGNGGDYRLARFNPNYTRRVWDILQPTKLGQPHFGELVSGDIDGDGYDEFVVNEFRSSRGNNSIMVGDFTAPRQFNWYPYIEGIRPRYIAVGNFVN